MPCTVTRPSSVPSVVEDVTRSRDQVTTSSSTARLAAHACRLKRLAGKDQRRETGRMKPERKQVQTHSQCQSHVTVCVAPRTPALGST